ncbi:MAG: Rne/Rng family ribonuclease [Schwartzia sp.]|nr:Rne/Rng family ribonuclease [Schwartzia sp. (in: firmicutes)]
MRSILVDVMPEETRMAVLEDGTLQALEVERPAHSHLVGNIYKGRVQNVLPGMQAAFVDIGGSKNAFLYIGDGRTADMTAGTGGAGRVHIGQTLLVQVVKDATGSKGPRVTTHLTLPGRNVVLMPTASYVSLSRRIDDEGERERLRQLAESLCPPDMGLIVRTAAAGQNAEAIRADVRYLARLWSTIEARHRLLAAPALLYRDAELAIRLVRDSMTEAVDELLVDDAVTYQRIQELLQFSYPELSQRVRLYGGSVPLFQEHGIEEAIAQLGERIVRLPSGGFLVIDHTEALTVIDVNTGKFVGEENLADTVYRMNMEAAGEILRQIRLRDIGGIIIVDFIDMETEEQKERLLEFLRGAARRDRSKTNIVGITALGLVEITRKKTRQNFESIVYQDCPACGGRGRVASAETVGIRVCRHIRRAEARGHAPFGYEVEVEKDVAAEINTAGALDGLRRDIGVPVKLTPRPDLHPGAYVITQRSR